MSNLVHNEQVKLEAIFYNNSAVAFAVGAVMTPALAISISHESWLPGLFILAGGIPASLYLHLHAVRLLRKLREWRR